MRQFNLKGEVVIPYRYNDDPSPGRTLYPEPLREAEGGWVMRNYAGGEEVMRREEDWSDEERRAVREWLSHVEAGRIG